jgi:hypothetical protein
LDYARARAQSTNFNVQTLGGLKQYIAGYIASRKSDCEFRRNPATDSDLKPATFRNEAGHHSEMKPATRAG